MSNLDGHYVDQFDGRFTGTFDIDNDEGEKLSYDDVVSFFVVASVDKANFSTTKAGELKRTNVFVVDSVKVLPTELSSFIFNSLSDETEPEPEHESESTFEVYEMGKEEPVAVVKDWDDEEESWQDEQVKIRTVKDKQLNDFLYGEI